MELITLIIHITYQLSCALTFPSFDARFALTQFNKFVSFAILSVTVECVVTRLYLQTPNLPPLSVCSQYFYSIGFSVHISTFRQLLH